MILASVWAASFTEQAVANIGRLAVATVMGNALRTSFWERGC